MLFVGSKELYWPRAAHDLFTQWVTMPHVLHAIEVRLHVHLAGVIILTPETADSVGALRRPILPEPIRFSTNISYTAVDSTL